MLMTNELKAGLLIAGYFTFAISAMLAKHFVTDSITQRTNMKIKNGTWVKMMAGDRDRVGDYSRVQNLDEATGECEFRNQADYCFGNIKEIGTPEQFQGDWYKTNSRLSYVLVEELDVPTIIRNRFPAL